MTLISILLFALVMPAQQRPPADQDSHTHPEAASLKNAVPATPESVASGNKLFGRYCASCHGTSGKGDGAAGAKLSPKPADLTDADWKHGSSDGEIFAIIREGSKNTGMKGYASRLTEHEIWDLVNYVKTLKP